MMMISFSDDDDDDDVFHFPSEPTELQLRRLLVARLTALRFPFVKYLTQLHLQVSEWKKRHRPLGPKR